MKQSENNKRTVETVLFPDNGKAEANAQMDPGCSLFPDCGGCTYRTITYEEELALKESQIRDLLEPVLPSWDDVYAGITGSPQATGYRNKMEYTFGDREKDGPLMLGMHRRGSFYDILPATDCCIAHEDMNRIVDCVQTWARETGKRHYHKRAHKGYFRHLLVRRASQTGEILVDLVTTSTEEVPLEEFVARLRALPLEGKLVGILHTVNDGVADTIRNDRTDILWGEDHFTEELMGLRFQITPFSFFQTNSRGAEVLYSSAREMLGAAREGVLFDLYSGTGTIAQMLAPAVRQAIGVEIVEEAVEAARRNAEENGLTNCTFLAGDVLRVLDEIPETPDVLVLDPPRDGVHPKALPKILAYRAGTILYISCKPSSLARDLPVIQEAGYVAREIRIVDMFPGTVNTEVLCLLQEQKKEETL